jgi:hypothetical protein
VKTSIAKYGNLLGNNEAHATGAKQCEEVLNNGPANHVGLSIPETKMELSEATGYLAFLKDLVSPGTVITFSAHIDPRRGDYKVAFGFKGGLGTAWGDIVKVEKCEFNAVFTRALKAPPSGPVKDAIYTGPAEGGCECDEKEDCSIKRATNATNSCWATSVALFGKGEMAFKVDTDTVRVSPPTHHSLLLPPAMPGCSP